VGLGPRKIRPFEIECERPELSNNLSEGFGARAQKKIEN